MLEIFYSSRFFKDQNFARNGKNGIVRRFGRSRNDMLTKFSTKHFLPEGNKMLRPFYSSFSRFKDQSFVKNGKNGKKKLVTKFWTKHFLPEGNEMLLAFRFQRRRQFCSNIVRRFDGRRNGGEEKLFRIKEEFQLVPGRETHCPAGFLGTSPVGFQLPARRMSSRATT